MPTLTGVHLLPATGEFTYDTIAHFGQRITETSPAPINTYSDQSPKTDYSVAIDDLQAQHPECMTVSIVCAWFCDGLTAGSANVYPSTTYVGGAFATANGVAENWQCSGLTQLSPELLPLPVSASNTFVYGGTPSDQSIVRCILDLKSRGFRVIFYPFLLMTAPSLPWRGRITYEPDRSANAAIAISSFLGAAKNTQFARDTTNLTVSYLGPPNDWTYRRMILHYANLCVVAGGVNLFAIGSELRGLETVRGPTWTKAGSTDAAGRAVWDYPFVAGLATLANDVRETFDQAGLPRNRSSLANLIAYSADWSSWMGYQHPGENGQWPHLDSLYADDAIDFVSFDNYLPLSDWTTDNGGLDALNWQSSPPTSWPVAQPNGRGFSLSGAPTLYSQAYLQANIEGGEKFDWFYDDSTNAGIGSDPRGSGLRVSLPKGDRVLQARHPYEAEQQILANKQLRWWWNHEHFALYDSGLGWARQGAPTQWISQSKSLLFLEYGIPSVDKGTNQPNLFFAPSSSESGTPYWSLWESAQSGDFVPLRDDTISALALDAIHSYWQTNNESAAGTPMIEWAFCCVWNWDARPFPWFPKLQDVWGDAANWASGDWQGAGRLSLPPVAPPGTPSPPAYLTFPTLATIGWSVWLRPHFSTDMTTHASGRESRVGRRSEAIYEIELNYDLLRADVHAELQAIAGFFLSHGAQNTPFWFAPPTLAVATNQAIGVGDGITSTFPLILTVGGSTAPVPATSGVSAIYLNGVEQSSGWREIGANAAAISFDTAPSLGVSISADFGALWLCRFADDVADLETFMELLWRWATLRLRTVRS